MNSRWAAEASRFPPIGFVGSRPGWGGGLEVCEDQLVLGRSGGKGRSKCPPAWSAGWTGAVVLWVDGRREVKAENTARLGQSRAQKHLSLAVTGESF